MSAPAEDFDEGGLLPGETIIPASTLAGITWFTPAQTKAYEQAMRFIERWQERDGLST